MATKETIEKTRAFWSPYEGRSLTDEECNEIYDNSVAFVKLLLEWDEEDRRAGVCLKTK